MTTEKTFPLAADMSFNFTASALDACYHCGRKREDHANEKCLFEPTFFAPHKLRTFFELLLTQGGTVSLRAGDWVFEQQVYARAYDVTQYNIRGDVRTMGEATLRVKESDAAQR